MRTTFEKAERIFRAGLSAVDAGKLVRAGLKRTGGTLAVQGRVFDLEAWQRIFVIAIGKASGSLASGFMDILGDRVSEGLVTCRPEELAFPGRLIGIPAAHPLPDGESVRAAEFAVLLARQAGANDVVFFLVSGGGSSHLCLPAPGISLEDKRRVTNELLKAGADIRELNIVRKHLSLIKGGGLAREAFPATVIGLIVSDVIGNDLEAIASGPAHWDHSTYGDAIGVLERYGLWQDSPPSIRDVLESGRAGRRPETPKADDPVFSRVHSFIIGDNRTALEAARAKAVDIGCDTMIISDSDHGEARVVARTYCDWLRNEMPDSGHSETPRCFLAGGEITVTVRGKGLGGRNTEFVLACLLELPPSSSGWLVLSLGTDGRDGPTDAAGAWADETSKRLAVAGGLDPACYLAENDSYSFFQKTGRLIMTGPTGTNVMDLRMFIIDRA
jgi:glycerate 2-kinase